jgi:nicotinamide-nucleotide amidase
MAPPAPNRAVILAVGSELTTGDTRDTNGGDLAADLSRMGVQVVRVTLLPDDLRSVAAAFREAIGEADLVVSTGGLGPTPDDLTREALAEALGEPVGVDARLERWLTQLFERRGMRMPEANRKQAWLIPGAEPLLNDHGTAPGWWVERNGTVIVTLPGPPRELRPMWTSAVLPRLSARGLGTEVAVRTLRLTGIGESYVVEALGEELLRAANPVVATYARPDAVDVRITARPEPGTGDLPGRSAAELLDRAQRRIEQVLGDHVFAHDQETWPDALGRRLGTRRVATWERGTGGTLAALLAGAPWFAHGEVVGSDPAEVTDGPQAAHGTGGPAARDLSAIVRSIRRHAGARAAVAVDATLRGGDTRVRVAVDVDGTSRGDTRTVFLGGEQGRRRAALAACAALWEALAPEEDGGAEGRPGHGI